MMKMLLYHNHPLVVRQLGAFTTHICTDDEFEKQLMWAIVATHIKEYEPRISTSQLVEVFTREDDAPVTEYYCDWRCILVVKPHNERDYGQHLETLKSKMR